MPDPPVVPTDPRKPKPATRQSSGGTKSTEKPKPSTKKK